MLIPFRVGDMVYRDYKNQAAQCGDDPKVIGKSDRTRLNRRERYEVLYFISCLARGWGWAGYPRIFYQCLEMVIRHQVPKKVSYHASIRNWIERHCPELVGVMGR